MAYSRNGFLNMTKDMVRPPGFEVPRSYDRHGLEAWEASVLTKLDHGRLKGESGDFDKRLSEKLLPKLKAYFVCQAGESTECLKSV